MKWCSVGLHDYVPVEITGSFYTQLPDLDKPTYHVLWYMQCSRCAKRSTKDTYKADTRGYIANSHVGLEAAKVAWTTYGLCAATNKNKPFSVVAGGKH